MAAVSKPKKLTPYLNYPPLPEGCKRLISIENARDASDIYEKLEITLVSTPLDECPPYTALSYTWGDPSFNIDPSTIILSKVARCYPIICHGHIILATRNLRDVLRRIRQYQTYRSNGEGPFEIYADPGSKILLQRTYGETTFYWIDSLCIDQDDILERSQQVSLMSRIYTKARHTIIWLGESDEYTRSAQSFLSKVALNAKVVPSTAKYHESLHMGREMRMVKAQDLDRDEQIAFVSIMSRSWFSRLWVLQECILSSQIGVLMGDLCFNFELLLHAANLECMNGDNYGFVKTAIAAAKTHPAMAPAFLSEKTFNSIQRLVYIGNCKEQIARGRLPNFLSIVGPAGSTEAKEPHDKIYAIMGIVSEFQSSGALVIPFDYTKSVVEIFVKSTYSVIHVRKDLAIIALTGPAVTIKNLPSWCPDYTSTRQVLGDIGALTRRWRFETSWIHPPSFELLEDYGLRVEGSRIDVVVESAPISFSQGERISPNDSSQLNFGITEMCAMAVRLDLSKQQVGTSHQSRVEILWRTMMLDELKGVSPVPDNVGVLFPKFIEFLLKNIVFYGSGESGRNRTLPLSEVELQSYVERLIFYLEALIVLEPQNRSLLPESTRLTAILATARREENANDKLEISLPNDDAVGPPVPNTTTVDTTDTSSEALADDNMLDRTFVRAFVPLMRASLVRLCNHTLGMTQAVAMPSDEIWVLHGALAPVCLRPISQGRYQCLGEVYVHGIMHGESTTTYGASVPIILK